VTPIDVARRFRDFVTSGPVTLARDVVPVGGEVAP
jgi:hypothetical protein